MNPSAEFLSPSEAARRLGVSAKALRVYEQRGLIAPARTAAGWRVYGPEALRRAGEVAALRSLGFSLVQIAGLLDRDPEGLAPALAAQQAALEGKAREISATLERLRRLRGELADDRATADEDRLQPVPLDEAPVVTFELPWPWGGERFELREIRPLTYITGPLFSGKTRLARRLAETLPDGTFLGLERLADEGAAARARLEAEPALRSQVERALARLMQDGAARSGALVALLAGLEAEGAGAVVVDMVEQGLDAATQRAIIADLRRRGAAARPLFLLTRSCEILELEAVGAREAILFCPANHSPPFLVDPCPGATGTEALASCLASPEVRARTEGVIAYRPPAA